ncbi:MAG: methionine--tRNA ligase, partial [Bifidobacteriaceae bacterium]|nr:methionine--tRNA ligase [Bifidobacteriaceae bacterium]
MSKKVLCCVAWPYANGPRHIGHVAGFGIPSDIFARYQRMAGNDVLMVSGTDEHGTPIQVQADQEGITPIELTDRYNSVIVDDLVDLGLTYDIFTRTTTSIHEETVQKMFTRLLDNGYIYLDSVLGAFSPSTGRALPDRYIEGVCPKCGYEQARGDQCDNCGIQLDPADLKNPRSKINGETPEFKESEHYFLDLPAFKDELRTYIDTVGTANKWRDNVKKFSLNLIDDLHSRAISRDIEWGITIPTDKYRDDNTKKLYVWFDAVIGYLSSSIEWATRFGDNPDSWRDYWNDRDTMTYYFMGKDNITFHTQIWPAELMGVNANSESTSEFGELNLPDNIVSSEFLTMNDEQFSSSRGHVIYVREMLDNYSADALRYYISVAGPEVQDSNFTWEDFVTRNNNELVAGWGNLINRVANLIFKNFGSVPDLKELTDAQANITTTAGGDSNVVNIDELGIALKAEIDAAFDVIGEL